jgi:hypothetical protein
MQACFVQESIVRNSTTNRLPRRTSFDSVSEAASIAASNRSNKSKPARRMTFMSTFPSHLPAQHQPASYSSLEESHTQPSSEAVPARSYFRQNRRPTQASTTTQASKYSRFSKFSRITSRSSSSSSSSASTEADESVKERHRVRRWGRRAVESLGRAFSAYPQGRTVGVVWYTGF